MHHPFKLNCTNIVTPPCGPAHAAMPVTVSPGAPAPNTPTTSTGGSSPQSTDLEGARRPVGGALNIVCWLCAGLRLCCALLASCCLDLARTLPACVQPYAFVREAFRAAAHYCPLQPGSVAAIHTPHIPPAPADLCAETAVRAACFGNLCAVVAVIVSVRRVQPGRCGAAAGRRGAHGAPTALNDCKKLYI